jgi:hypothetical protein
MPSYEMLDAIADSYNPLLALISLIFIAASLFKAQWKLAGLRLIAFAVVVFIAYGLMFLDRSLNIWPAFGWDYSTHGAVAIGLVIFLCLNARKAAILWIGSFIGYVLLMLYQGYHTIADIATTIIAVGIPIELIMGYLYGLWGAKIKEESIGSDSNDPL